MSAETELANLKAAIDSALSPSGILSELSRIIAEFAQPLPKWDATCQEVKNGALILDAESASVRCMLTVPHEGLYCASEALCCVLSARSLHEFSLPPPRTGLDEKTCACNTARVVHSY
jgi:hypothetical protein